MPIDEALPYWAHWYDVVEGQELVLQGDILRNMVAWWLPSDLPIDPTGGTDERVDVEKNPDLTWIILSATCDAANPARAAHLLLAPVYEASEDTLRPKKGQYEQQLEALRQGLYPRKFLLPPNEGIDPPFPLSVVFFGHLALLPREYVTACASRQTRLRLCSPYREAFGNWVGRRFSEVGWPEEANMPRHAGGTTAEVRVQGAAWTPESVAEKRIRPWWRRIIERLVG